MKNSNNIKCWQGCGEIELLHIASGNAKSYSLFRKEFGSFLNNPTYTYYMTQQSHSWAFIPTKWLYVFVHSSCIYYNQNWTIKMPYNRWMAKHSIMCLYQAMQISNKKISTTDQHNNWLDLKSIRLSEKTNLKMSLHDAIYIKTKLWRLRTN